MTYRIFTDNATYTDYKLVGEFTDFFTAYFEYCRQMSNGAHLVQFYKNDVLFVEYVKTAYINR